MTQFFTSAIGTGSAPSTLPSPQSSAWQIVHQMPGRIRVRLPELKTFLQQQPHLPQTLEAIPNVRQVRVNIAARSVVVCYGSIAPSEFQAQLSQCLAELTAIAPEYEVNGASASNTTKTAHDHPFPIVKETLEPHHSALRLPLLASALAVASQWSPLRGLRPLAGATLALAIWPIAQRAWQSLWGERRLNIDCLDFLALSLSAWQGRLVTPALVITLHEIGDAIRDRTARATEVRSSTLADAIGRFAWVQGNEGELRQVPSDQVPLGNIVYIRESKFRWMARC